MVCINGVLPAIAMAPPNAGGMDECYARTGKKSNRAFENGRGT